MKVHKLSRLTMLASSLALLATPAALAQSGKYADRTAKAEHVQMDAQRKEAVRPKLQKQAEPVRAQVDDNQIPGGMFKPDKKKSFPGDTLEAKRKKKEFPDSTFEREQKKAYPDSVFEGEQKKEFPDGHFDKKQEEAFPDDFFEPGQSSDRKRPQ